MSLQDVIAGRNEARSHAQVSLEAYRATSRQIMPILELFGTHATLFCHTTYIHSYTHMHTKVHMHSCTQRCTCTHAHKGAHALMHAHAPLSIFWFNRSQHTALFASTRMHRITLIFCEASASAHLSTRPTST
jgi:hypothetical protein